MPDVRNQKSEYRCHPPNKRRAGRTEIRKKNINPIVCSVLSVFCLLLPVTCYNLYAEQWEELKGEHFIIYFEKDKKFAKQVLDKAESYYKEIADDLGYQRYSEFWLWERRCKIYLYPDHDSYIKATNRLNWSHGQADYTNKAVSGYMGSRLFLNAILPHELGHLIFRDFVGFKGEVPLWLDEGVAQWQERAKPRIVKNDAAKLLKAGKLIPLKTMMELDIRKVEDEELVRIFYEESASLVDFLIRKYGTGKFTVFCQQLRDGKTLEEALKSSYSPSIRTIEDFEREWKKQLLD